MLWKPLCNITYAAFINTAILLSLTLFLFIMKGTGEKLLLAIRVSLKCSLVAWKCIVKKVSLKISVLESLLLYSLQLH